MSIIADTAGSPAKGRNHASSDSGLAADRLCPGMGVPQAGGDGGDIQPGNLRVSQGRGARAGRDSQAGDDQRLHEGQGLDRYDGIGLKLVDLYSSPGLWFIPLEILKEREPYQSISHKSLPTWDKHCEFIRTHPYRAWYAIRTALGDWAGCVYLSRNREIGIGILKKHQGRGYATAAIQLLMARHPGRFLANINPANEASIRLFAKFGAKHIQNTYELGAA